MIRQKNQNTHLDAPLSDAVEVCPELPVAEALLLSPPDLHSYHAAPSSHGVHLPLRLHLHVGEIPVQQVHCQLVHVVTGRVLTQTLHVDWLIGGGGGYIGVGIGVCEWGWMRLDG